MSVVHREYLELAASAIDFGLSDAERARLDGHLAGCDVCRRRVAALRADDVAMAALPSFALGAEAADRLRPVFRRPPRLDVSMLRLVIVAAMLATVVLASLAIGAELVRREVERRLVVVPPAPVTLPAPSARSVPSPVAFGDWRSIGPVEPLVNGQVQLVLPSIDGVRVLGCVEASAGLCGDTATWQSSDGVTWTRPQVLPTDPVEAPHRISAAALNTTPMLVGGLVLRDGAYRAAIWSSEDGQTWTRAGDDPSFGSATITTFVETTSGWVALGSGLSEQEELAGLRAWTSLDGLAWSPVPQAETDDTAYPIGTFIQEDDSYLAWGPIDTGTRWWASVTGETWDAIPDPPGLEGAAISTIEYTDGAPMAVGWDGVAGPIGAGWWSRPAGSAEWFRADDGSEQPVTGTIRFWHRVDGTVSVAGDETASAVWYRPRDGDWNEISSVPMAEPVGLAQLTETNIFVLVLRDDQGLPHVATGEIDLAP